ncbi:hypothetical protein HKD37_15G043072 [Glycine soja]
MHSAFSLVRSFQSVIGKMLTIIRTLLENLVLRSMCSNNVLIIVDIINCTLVGKTLNQIHNTTFCKKLVLWHSNGVARIILGCGDVDKRKIKGAVGVAIACLSSVAAGNVGVTLLPCRGGKCNDSAKTSEINQADEAEQDSDLDSLRKGKCFVL